MPLPDSVNVPPQPHRPVKVARVVHRIDLACGRGARQRTILTEQQPLQGALCQG